MACHPFKLWTSSVVAMKMYGGHRCWGEAHDWALVHAVTKYGHGRWKDYLSNGENNMAAALCEELGLEPLTEECIDLSQSPERELNDPSAMRIEKSIVRGRAEDEAVLKSKIRSMETKCRSWMASRLKLLADFMADEAAPRSQQSVQLTTHPVSASLTIPGSLQCKYQAIVRHCSAVREGFNRGTRKRSYEEHQAPGIQFRTQMQELGQMADGLCQSLPADFETFKNAEAELKQRQLCSMQWTAASPIPSSSTRLDPSFGTFPPTSNPAQASPSNPVQSSPIAVPPFNQDV